MKVEKVINDMQVLELADKPEAVTARTVYNKLTADQKAYVTNYELLKEAENKIAKWENKSLLHKAPENIIYSGARSSNYGPGTPWLDKAEWGSVAQDMKSYFPDSQSTMVWIIGALHGDGINLEFDKPNWLTEEWLAEKEYRSLANISFGEIKKEGHASHEEYLDYFDEHGIKIYLQVESGFSDIRTLMDIIIKQYGHHSCIAGFGVDVEWYYGIDEDSGLPVTDDLAKLWDQHLKTLNNNYRLFLKHYNINYLPKSYRSNIIFVDDSQSFGSMNGDALGQYDDNLDDVLGFIPEFKDFADFFKTNDVIYQIGYAPDRMWYYTLDDSVIQSLGIKLAEATSQNCGIVWVDFTLKDPLTFPQLLTPETKLKSLKTLVGYFRNASSNMVGKRFSSGQATYHDALFVKRITSLIEQLSEAEQKSFWALFTSDNDKKAVEGYQDSQARAIDIRILNLSKPLREKDILIVQEIEKDFNKLTELQKAKVTLKIPDISSLIKQEDPIGSGETIVTEETVESSVDGKIDNASLIKTGDSTYPILCYIVTANIAIFTLYILNRKKLINKNK